MNKKYLACSINERDLAEMKYDALLEYHQRQAVEHFGKGKTAWRDYMLTFVRKRLEWVRAVYFRRSVCFRVFNENYEQTLPPLTIAARLKLHNNRDRGFRVGMSDAAWLLCDDESILDRFDCHIRCLKGNRRVHYFDYVEFRKGNRPKPVLNAEISNQGENKMIEMPAEPLMTDDFPLMDAELLRQKLSDFLWQCGWHLKKISCGDRTELINIVATTDNLDTSKIKKYGKSGYEFRNIGDWKSILYCMVWVKTEILKKSIMGAVDCGPATSEGQLSVFIKIKDKDPIFVKLTPNILQEKYSNNLESEFKYQALKQGIEWKNKPIIPKIPTGNVIAATKEETYRNVSAFMEKYGWEIKDLEFYKVFTDNDPKRIGKPCISFTAIPVNTGMNVENIFHDIGESFGKIVTYKDILLRLLELKAICVASDWVNTSRVVFEFGVDVMRQFNNIFPTVLIDFEPRFISARCTREMLLEKYPYHLKKALIDDAWRKGIELIEKDRR